MLVGLHPGLHQIQNHGGTASLATVPDSTIAALAALVNALTAEQLTRLGALLSECGLIAKQRGSDG